MKYDVNGGSGGICAKGKLCKLVAELLDHVDFLQIRHHVKLLKVLNSHFAEYRTH